MMAPAPEAAEMGSAGTPLTVEGRTTAQPAGSSGGSRRKLQQMGEAGSSMMMQQPAPAPEMETAGVEAPFAEGEPFILQGLSTSGMPAGSNGSRRLQQVSGITSGILPSVISTSKLQDAVRTAFGAAPVAEAPVMEGARRMLMQEGQAAAAGSAEAAREGTAGLEGTTGGPAETSSGLGAVQPIPGDLGTTAVAGAEPGTAGQATITAPGRAAAQPGDVASSATLGAANLPSQQPSVASPASQLVGGALPVLDITTFQAMAPAPEVEMAMAAPAPETE